MTNAKMNSFRMSSQTLKTFLPTQKITESDRRRYFEQHGVTLPGDFLYKFEALDIDIIIDDDLSQGQILTNITDENGNTYDIVI